MRNHADFRPFADAPGTGKSLAQGVIAGAAVGGALSLLLVRAPLRLLVGGLIIWALVHFCGQ